MCAFSVFANGKTLEKGRVSRKEAGRGLNIKIRQTTAQPCPSFCPGLILEEAHTSKIQTFNPHRRNKVDQIY